MLVFDGDCGFCRRSVGWARRLGATCAFRASYDVDLAALGLTPEEALEAAWFVGADGRLYRGHEAIALVLLSSRHRVVQVLGHATRSRLLGPVAARVYAWVSAHRHQLPGGSSSCAVD